MGLAAAARIARAGRSRRFRVVACVLVALFYLGVGYAAYARRTDLALWNEQMRAHKQTHTFEQIMWIHNGGSSALRISAAHSSQRGVVMIGTDATGKQLEPAWTLRIVMRYRVEDCRAVLHGPYPRGGPLPVAFGLHRWWGTQTVTLADHGVGYSGDALEACA